MQRNIFNCTVLQMYDKLGALSQACATILAFVEAARVKLKLVNHVYSISSNHGSAHLFLLYLSGFMKVDLLNHSISDKHVLACFNTKRPGYIIIVYYRYQ